MKANKWKNTFSSMKHMVSETLRSNPNANEYFWGNEEGEWIGSLWSHISTGTYRVHCV